MQLERQKHLKAAPFERSPERRGRANGYKPKTVKTRVGAIAFDVPQVQEGGFYPEALEKGQRSERALMLALAEMYVQGVSIRKVAAITEQLIGSAVSSSQVSRAASPDLLSSFHFDQHLAQELEPFPKEVASAPQSMLVKVLF